MSYECPSSFAEKEQEHFLGGSIWQKRVFGITLKHITILAVVGVFLLSNLISCLVVFVGDSQTAAYNRFWFRRTFLGDDTPYCRTHNVTVNVGSRYSYVQMPVKRLIVNDSSFDQANPNNVACWPSSGGVWIKYTTPVEMAWLGLDRVNDNERSADANEEDAFCERLRMLGASFWSIPDACRQYPDEEEPNCNYIRDQPDGDGAVVVGFPDGGGVWVLDQAWDAFEFEERPQEDYDWAKAGLYNALSMGERADVIRRLGGRYCKEVHECVPLALARDQMRYPSKEL